MSGPVRPTRKKLNQLLSRLRRGLRRPWRIWSTYTVSPSTVAALQKKIARSQEREGNAPEMWRVTQYYLRVSETTVCRHPRHVAPAAKRQVGERRFQLRFWAALFEG